MSRTDPVPRVARGFVEYFLLIHHLRLTVTLEVVIGYFNVIFNDPTDKNVIELKTGL